MMMQPQYGMPMTVHQQISMPMMQQASMPMFMTAPLPSPSQIPQGTPPGLEFLLPTNQIMIQQQMEWGEILTGMHTNNKYHILDAWGRRMYFAGENSDCCNLMCCGNMRPWTINIFDCMGQLVMEGNRDSGCLACCGNSVQVASFGMPIGGIVQNCEPCSASWNITDGSGAPVLLLKAPDCTVCCPGCTTCYEADFPLVTLQNGQQIGKITKYFGGFLKEMMTAADTFGVEFPVDLDVKLKAVLIYATFLIDFMYYEDVQSQQHHHHHHHGYY